MIRIYEQTWILDVVTDAVARSPIVNAAAMEERIYQRIVDFFDHYDTTRISKRMVERIIYKALCNSGYKQEDSVVFSALEGDSDRTYDVAGADTIEDYIGDVSALEAIDRLASDEFERSILTGLLNGYNASELASVLRAHKADIKVESVRRVIGRFRAKCRSELAI